MKMFRKLVPTYDSELMERIQGALPSEIDQLERLIDRPLPVEYRDYLALMGWYDDGLDVFVDAHAYIPDILEYYIDCKEDGDEAAPEDCIMVAVNGVGVDDFCLHENGRVYFCDRTIIGHPFAEELDKLATGKAFNRYQRRKLDWTASFVLPHGPVPVPAVTYLGREMGFDSAEFSDPWRYFGLSSSACIVYIYLDRGPYCLLTISGSRQVVERLGMKFEAKLGFMNDEYIRNNQPLYRRLPPRLRS